MGRLSTSAILQAAGEHIAALGLPMVQARRDGVGPKGKKRAPLRRKGQGWEGSLDLAQLEAWFTESPSADNLGACLDGSGYLILDVDWHDELGALGWETLQAMCLEAGLAGGVDALVELTAYARSPGGGTHIWFREPTGWALHSERKIGVRPKLDMLCGGFVMLPPSAPSVTADETYRYRWIRSPLARGALAAQGPELEAEGVPVAELPAALAEVLLMAVARRERSTGGASAAGVGGVADAERRAQLLEHGSPAGQRNSDLVELVGWLRRRVGDTPSAHLEIREMIEKWRDRCQPPYRGPGEDEEVERSWQSALAQPHTNEWADITWPAGGAGSPMDAAGLESLDHQGLAQFLEPYIGAGVVWEEDSQRVYYYDVASVRWAPDDGVSLYNALEAPTEAGGFGALPALKAVVQAEMDVAMGAGDKARVSELRKWYRRAVEPSVVIPAARTVAGRKEAGRRIRRLDLDAQAHFLTVRNGWVDLRTGAVMSHEEARAEGWRNACLADVIFDPLATSSIWQRTLDLMLPGDMEMQGYLQRALGASLFGDNRAKSAYVLHGDTNNGKSTLFNILHDVLGSGYAAVGAREVFVEHKGKAGSAGEKHLTGLADAMDHRLIYLPEYGEQDQLNGDTVKQLTGDDLIQVRRMRQDHYVAESRCTPWILSNHRVDLGSFGPAIMARVKLIELPGEIPVESRRPASEVRTLHRGSDVRQAILAWLVQGAVEYSRAGLQEPVRMRAALDELEREQNPVRRWLDELVAAGGGVTPWAELTHPDLGCTRAQAYEHYTAWAGKHAYGSVRFGRELSVALERSGAGKAPSDTNGVRFRPDPGQPAQRYWPVRLPAYVAPWTP